MVEKISTLQSNGGDSAYNCCNAFTVVLNHNKHQDNGDFMAS